MTSWAQQGLRGNTETQTWVSVSTSIKTIYSTIIINIDMSILTCKANGIPWRINGLWFKSVNFEFNELKIMTDTIWFNWTPETDGPTHSEPHSTWKLDNKEGREHMTSHLNTTRDQCGLQFYYSMPSHTEYVGMRTLKNSFETAKMPFSRWRIEQAIMLLPWKTAQR